MLIGIGQEVVCCVYISPLCPKGDYTKSQSYSAKPIFGLVYSLTQPAGLKQQAQEGNWNA